MQQPLIIHGFFRSGTGIVSQILEICGANKGNVDKSQSNYLIREEWMKPLLMDVGLNEQGIETKGLDNYGFAATPVAKKLEELLQCQDMKGVWLYKDVRNTLVWKLWRQLYPQAYHIVVRRETKDILHACERTAYMDYFCKYNNRQQYGVKTPRDGWKMLLKEYENKWEQMRLSGINYWEIHPYMFRNLQGLKTIIEVCGLEWKENEVKQFLKNNNI